MKTLHIVITVISLLFLTILASSNFVQAYPYISFQDRYIMSDVVLIGKITAAREYSSTQTIYDVQVEQYLKNLLPEDKITVIAQDTKNTQSPRAPPDLAFSVGDRAFFYLKEQSGNYNAMWFSYAVDSLCDPSPTYQDIQRLTQMTNSTDHQWLHILHDGKEGPFRTGQNLMISYTAWNTYLIPKTFEIAFNVTRVNDSSLVFHDSNTVTLKPCLGYQIVTTNFTPKESGDYNVMVSFDKSFGGQLIQVRNNFSGGVIDGPVSILSPLKQFKSGIAAKDVKCHDDLVLTFKAEDGSPACVKSQTAFKLVQRGWGVVDGSTMMTMNIDNTKFSTNYTITNAKILNIKMDTQSLSVIVTMLASDDGNLIIKLPQELLQNSRSDLHHCDLIVLNDGQEIEYKEIKTTPTDKTLLVPFVNGTRTINIIEGCY